MRRLIFILLAMIGVSQAQTIQYIGAPTTTVISRGNFRTDSIFYLPKRSKAPTDTAAFRYQISDSSLYVWTGSQWVKAGGSGTINGTLTTNYIPKATGSTTLGNSVMYDSSGHVRVYGNYVGNTNPNRLLFTSEISGNNGYTALFKQSDSITDAGQFPLILRKGLLTSDKPRPNYGVGMETQLQDDAGTWRRSGFLVNRIVDSTAANFRTKFDFRLINGSTYPIPLIVSGDSSIRMAKLAGSGTRYVVADANGDLSATGSTALVDTTTISTRAWRQKGLDSLAALEVSGSGTTNYVPKFTAASTIGNSQIFDNGTNVGIGITTGMSERFNVANSSGNANASISTSSATSGAFLRFGNATNADGLYLGYNNPTGSLFGGVGGANGGVIMGYGAYPIGFGTNATERLRIFANGRIGMNTTTDAGYQLDVNGTLRTVNGANFATTSGNVGIGTATPGELLSLKGSNAAIKIEGATNNYLLQIVDANNRFRVFDNSASLERLTILTGGDVGIGTPTPSYKLDINGTLRSVNGANFATTSGNVGIGTASPQQILHANAPTGAYIQLSRTAQGGTTSPFGGIYFGDGTTFQEAAILSGADGNVVSGNMAFYTRAAAGSLLEGFRVNSTQEMLVGGGSDAGDYKLQVSGNIYNTGSAVLAATSGEAYIGTTSDAGNYKLQVSGQAFIRNTATSGALYLDSTSLSIYEVKNRHAILISGHSLTGAEIQGPIYVGTNWNTSSDVSAIEVALTNTASGANSNLMKLSDGTNTFRVTKDAGIFTAAPSGGTARKWKLGSVVATSVILDTANYVEVEINGVAYKLALATPN